MSRRDWTQNAFAAAAAAIAGGAGLPARADEIDDKYAQIMSAAAEEVIGTGGSQNPLQLQARTVDPETEHPETQLDL